MGRSVLAVNGECYNLQQKSVNIELAFIQLQYMG